jgi:PBP1b-binding outer membrane lipoprotein LpoB
MIPEDTRSLRLLLILCMGLFLAACGGIQEMWEGPGAESFRPKSIAVLPPIVGAYENARDAAQGSVTAALKESHRYEAVMPAEQVVALFQGSKETNDALANYFSKLETVGASDKDAAIKLGHALKADALLVVKVNSWEYAREDGDKLAKVALGFRLVDTKTGMIIWKARHETSKSYIIFKPKLQYIASDLSEYMIKHMPN